MLARTGAEAAGRLSAEMQPELPSHRCALLGEPALTIPVPVTYRVCIANICWRSWGRGLVLNLILQGTPEERGLSNKQRNEASHHFSSVPCTATLRELTESPVAIKSGTSSVSLPHNGLF